MKVDMFLVYLLLLNLAPCDISIDNGVGPFRLVSGGSPNILSRAVCPYFRYCLFVILGVLKKFKLIYHFA